MKLYIVRHGLAGEHGDPRYPDDRLRPLTDEGRKRFANTVKALAAAGMKVSVIATSPLVRCRQTADILAERLSGKPKLTELEALRPAPTSTSSSIGRTIRPWTKSPGSATHPT